MTDLGRRKAQDAGRRQHSQISGLGTPDELGTIGPLVHPAMRLHRLPEAAQHGPGRIETLPARRDLARAGAFAEFEPRGSNEATRNIEDVDGHLASSGEPIEFATVGRRPTPGGPRQAQFRQVAKHTAIVDDRSLAEICWCISWRNRPSAEEFPMFPFKPHARSAIYLKIESGLK
ncbi:hypothetical protein MesoLjLc_71280 [Mesorhizobium sp. L-8-10]|nr:hypothetical protein MesoLjLc_71280 [Mesorhizobium sp. L-8-10]